MSGWFLPIVCSIVLQRHCKLASSLSTLSASYILTGFETCSLHTFLGLISLSWFPAMEFFPLSLPLLFHPTLGVLGICCPNCSSSDPTVHPGCLKNSASQLSCTLRKYFLGFVEQRNEMPSIVKGVCGTAGGWTLISTCLSSTLITWSSPLLQLRFICWGWTSVSNCIFHLFSLNSAYSLRHWRRVGFLHVRSLLQYYSFIPSFFASLRTSQVMWNQVSIPFHISDAAFCIPAHTCHQKFNLCPPF